MRSAAALAIAKERVSPCPNVTHEEDGAAAVGLSVYGLNAESGHTLAARECAHAGASCKRVNVKAVAPLPCAVLMRSIVARDRHGPPADLPLRPDGGKAVC